MSMPNIGLTMALMSQTHIGPTHVESSVKPYAQQYAMGPGDVAVLSDTTDHANHDNDGNPVVVTILDPELHHEQFPDYADRLRNSFVLTEWVSAKDHGPHLGWFARVRLMPVENPENVTEFRQMILDGEIPKDPPDWMEQAYTAYNDGLASVQSGIGVRPTCGMCGSRNVDLHVVTVTTYTGPARQVVVDNKVKYWGPTQEDANTVAHGHLHCSDCKGKSDVSGEDFATQGH